MEFISRYYCTDQKHTGGACLCSPLLIFQSQYLALMSTHKKETRKWNNGTDHAFSMQQWSCYWRDIAVRLLYCICPMLLSSSGTWLFRHPDMYICASFCQKRVSRKGERSTTEELISEWDRWSCLQHSGMKSKRKQQWSGQHPCQTTGALHVRLQTVNHDPEFKQNGSESFVTTKRSRTQIDLCHYIWQRSQKQ